MRSWITCPELLAKRLASDEAKKAAKRPDLAEYMRNYRKRNAEKVRSYDRERYAINCRKRIQENEQPEKGNQ